jgi:hypothetical protein
MFFIIDLRRVWGLGLELDNCPSCTSTAASIAPVHKISDLDV